MQLRIQLQAPRRDGTGPAYPGATIGLLLLACLLASSARAQCTDTTPPELVITSPARSAMLAQGGTADDTVVVSGYAQDAESPLVSLVIDGQEQLSGQATGMVPFDVPTNSPWGLSIVTTSATDACGNRAEQVQSYLRSGAYFPAPTDPSPDATVAGALGEHLNQALLDDGNRSDPDDLTTLDNDAIAAIDWDSVIPNPMASKPFSNRRCSKLSDSWTEIDYDVQHGTIAATNLRLDSLTAVAGGIQAALALDSLQVPLSAHVTSRTCAFGVGPAVVGPLTVTGSVGATDLSADGLLSLSLAGGQAQAQVDNPSVDYGNASISLDCGGFPAFVCNAIDSFSSGVLNFFEARVGALLASQLANRVGPTVTTLLNGLQTDSTVNLPPPISVTMDVSSAYDLVSANASGVDLGIATQVSPRARGARIPADARGAIRRDGALSFDIADGHPLGIALKDDLVNELLWATWYGGGFDLPDVTAEAQSLGYPVEDLSVQVGLPPLVQPGASPGVAEIGVGDVRVQATVDLSKLGLSGVVTVDFYLSALLDGRLGLAPPGRLRFDIASTQVATQIVASSNPLLAEAARPALEQLVATVAQVVVDRILGGLRVPAFDLARVGLPAGTALGLGTGTIDRPTAAYTRLAMDVAVYAPKGTLGLDASTCTGTSLAPNPYTDGVGYLFTPLDPITVTALGDVTSVANIAGDVVVGLYDVTAGGSESDLLAEYALPAESGEPALDALPVGGAPGSTQDFFYHRALLASPVLLHAGRQYGIVAWGDGGGGVLDHPFDVTVAPEIRFDQSLLGSGAQSGPGNGMIQDLDGAPGRLTTFGPTIEFAPEPGAVAGALVALATLGIARGIRRQRRA
jgi:hypothetical protein